MCTGSVDEIRGASKALRVVNNLISQKLIKRNPVHSGYPSRDVHDAIDLAGERSDDRALEWYRRGVIRGIISATDWLVDDTITMKGKTLTLKGKMTVGVRVKMNGKWKPVRLTILPEDVGFK